MNVDVSCIHVFHISSLVLLGDEFSGFVRLRKTFRAFNRLISDMWLYSWCFVYAGYLDISLRLATILLISGGAMPESRCRLSVLVGYPQ